MSLNLNGIGRTTKKANSSILNESVERMDDLEATLIRQQVSLHEVAHLKLDWLPTGCSVKDQIQVCCQEHDKNG